MARRLKTVRAKNPHWTTQQQEEIDAAEQWSTRATIYELGVAEFLKTHLPCLPELETANDVLADSIHLRQKSQDVHDNLRVHHVRKRKTA